MSACKGKKHYELEDLMKKCQEEGEPPQKLMNHIFFPKEGVDKGEVINMITTKKTKVPFLQSK